jgi:dipeptidyl aminopeptidase/acylaminoacyl peptidase
MKTKKTTLFIFVLLMVIFISTAQTAKVPDSSENTGSVNDIELFRDGITLKGKLFQTEGTGPFTTVLMLPGFPGGELGLCKNLAQSGVNVLIFNYSGTHRSEGEWSFENSQKDIREAFRFLQLPENVKKYNIDTSHIVLGGYSYGGGMALVYAANHPEVSSVFAIAGTDHAEMMREYYRGNESFKSIVDNMFEQLKTPSGPVRFAKGASHHELTSEAVAAVDLRLSAPLLFRKNILLIAGWNDEQVTVEGHILPFYRELQKEGAKNLKLIALQDEHNFRNSREELPKIIIDWIKMTEK